MNEPQPNQDAAHKRVKHRSPSYPAVDLEKAIERAQRLRDVAGKHAAPLESAVKAWGYSPKSSGGLQTVAALKQYGLVDDSGTGWGRQITLTQDAQELLVYGADKESAEWRSRARIAVLRPKVHRTLWDKYEESLPSDSVMLPFLKLDLNFSDESAIDMLKRFRSSLAFARLSSEGDSLSEVDSDSGTPIEIDTDRDSIVSPQALETPQTPPSSAPGPSALSGQRSVQITYSPDAWATIQAPFPMNEDDWEAMIATLNGMKRGLVRRGD